MLKRRDISKIRKGCDWGSAKRNKTVNNTAKLTGMGQWRRGSKIYKMEDDQMGEMETCKERKVSRPLGAVRKELNK